MPPLTFASVYALCLWRKRVHSQSNIRAAEPKALVDETTVEAG
jgi:hypothetical protein